MGDAPAGTPSLVPLLTAAEMRAWDERAICETGIPGAVLMENAGRATARIVHALHPRGRIVAAAGRGNNGGDAVVALRTLRAWGREVSLLRVGGDSRDALLHGWQLPLVDEGAAEAALQSASAVLDGLLGTGASGAPRPAYAQAIRAINASGRPVVALDGPSGVDFTTGAVEGEAVGAQVTVSFGAPKRGLLLHPARTRVGRLLVAEIGFPPWAAYGEAAVATGAWAASTLPPRAWNAHKGDAGKVVVIAGHPGIGGAAILAGMGALRAGAGVLRVVSAAENRLAVQSAVPEALFSGLGEGDIAELLNSADSLVVGPAMGTDRDAAALLSAALRESAAPAVLDADATTLISRDASLLPRSAADRVLLTPHPLELARLLECETAEVLRDPFAAARAAVERYGCAVLLKGSPSLVAAPGERTIVVTTGHAGVATGGMGDTLAGVAGTLLAAGASPRDAGALALFFCGRAAELAGRGRGLLPRDVAEALPAALLSAPPLSPFGPGVLLDLPIPA